VVAPEQWDPSSAFEMLARLHAAGVEVHRARAVFTAGGKSYPAGTTVMLAGQAFRSYLVDLMEPQRYPQIRTGANGPTRRPYDVAGWTLPMNMGVNVLRVDEPFQADLELLSRIEMPAPSRDHRENSSFIATAELLEKKAAVRWGPAGEILVEGEDSGEKPVKARYELRRPRLALYESWSANMDTGWTQWVLDTYKVPYTLARNEDFQKGGLGARFDSVLLASQSAASILHGTRPWEPTGRGTPRPIPTPVQRPEYTGGMGIAGLYHLESFVREGGTLIAFDGATELPIQYFPLPVRNLLRSSSEPSSSAYYCPGSLLRIRVDNTHRLAFGMPAEAIAFSTGGQAFEISLLAEYNKDDREIRSVAKYAEADLLASGWVSGERAVLGKHILLEARYGKGRVVLFGFRPQFRGQTFGAFKLLLNAIYLASAKVL